MAAQPAVPWWGPITIGPGASRCLRLGPMRLWLGRDAHAIRLAWSTDESTGPWPAGAWLASDEAFPPETAETLRLVVPGDERVRLMPTLADRPVVARARQSLLLPPASDAIGYVSTPLWISICSADGSVLWERPCLPMKQTWFGPDTLSGDLGYASRTDLALSLDDRLPVPHRALTRVRMINAGDSPLVISRVRLPVPRLPLLAGPSAAFSTPDVTVTREHDPTASKLQIQDLPRTPPPGAPSLVAEARQPGDGPGMVHRIFTAFLP